MKIITLFIAVFMAQIGFSQSTDASFDAFDTSNGNVNLTAYCQASTTVARPTGWYKCSPKGYVTSDGTNKYAVLESGSANYIRQFFPVSVAKKYFLDFDIKVPAGTNVTDENASKIFITFNKSAASDQIAVQSGKKYLKAIDGQNAPEGVFAKSTTLKIGDIQSAVGVWKHFKLEFLPEFFEDQTIDELMFSFGGPPKTYDVMVDNLAVTEQTGLLSSDAPTLTTLAVYPNPASTKIYIDGVSSIESISLLNTLGQNVAASFNGSLLDVAGLPSGVYILTVVADGKSTSQKVLIE